MQYTRDKDGYLCYTDKNGKIISRVPDDKEPSTEEKYMFSVDDEPDDAWEDNLDPMKRPWTE
jgi:hypothetical protein